MATEEMKPEVAMEAESRPVVAESGPVEVERTQVTAENVLETVVVERRPVEAKSEPMVKVIVPASLDTIGNNGEPVVVLS